ncbi:carbohydrate kinase pfkb [Trichococcus palustris]|uniref:Tagatose-6-phosphate kinase n=1 Tax=Trichococcus palustris TaxID=140314 RepID=A0A143YY82_9LACT|nr:1-phosphofructokinase [Trichococcus palustris]CZR01397.1 carbohydrate kinase pfkb [Trichococcus palustris]SFL07035.1 fructose-1-phosphate kinase [Trichococcus palustris]
MIYTITLNPTIDYIVNVPNLTLGKSHHMQSELIRPGGKGLLVSRVLKELDTPSIALGFRGGFTGEFVRDYLDELQIINSFTEIAERTRINLVLKSDQDTEISDYGPSASEAEVKEFMEQFDGISPQDFVVLSGSKLPSMPADFYEQLIRLLAEEGVPFACDITKEELRNSLQYHPLVVKPNQKEVGDLFGKKFETWQEVVPYGKQLLEAGAQHAIVSLGGDGALLFTPREVIYAPPVPGKVGNPVGAGDSMVAGFVGTYLKMHDPVEAFRVAVACGTATAFSSDIATASEIQVQLPRVVLEQIE